MKLKKVSRMEFYEAFIEVPRFKFSKFTGWYEPSSDWECYLSEDKLSGFAITKDKELVNLFNANPDYTMLKDKEVADFINDNVDWFVCIGYYDYQTNGIEFGTPQISLSEYYTSTLNFDEFGETQSDTEDMIESIGLGHTVAFVKEFGIPFHIFFLNRKYPVVNKGYYDNNEYAVAKKNILDYIKMSSEN